MNKFVVLFGLLCITNVALALDKWLIIQSESIGKVKAGWTANDVKVNFQQDEYRFQEIDIGEGMTEPGLIIFPNTANELKINIQGKNKSLVNARSCNMKGQWATPEGLKVGSTMEQVEHVNEGPITILGWGWDYGGQMFSNNKGKYKGPHLWFRMPSSLDKEFIGDKEIGSSIIPNKDKIIIRCLDVNLRKNGA